MFVLILALGSFLRMLNFLKDRSFWGDEFFTIFLVSQPLKNVLAGAIHDVHPPLYPISYYFFTKLFGDHEWVFRLNPFLFSVAIIIAVYYLSKAFFEEKIALTASFLTAISPYFMQLSDEIRGYNLFAVMASVAILSFSKLLQNPSETKWIFLYILTGLAAVYTQHYGWFLLLATSVLILWLWLGHKRPNANVLWAQVALFISAVPAFILLVYQAFFYESAHLYRERIKDYLGVPVLFKKIVGIFWHWSCGYPYSMLTVERISYYLKHSWTFWISGITVLMMLLLVVRGFAALYRKDRKAFILFFMILVFPVLFLLAFYAIRLDARYMSFAAPVYMILVSAGLFSLKSKKMRMVCLMLILAASFFGTFKTIVLPTDPIHKEDYKGCLRYVLTQATEEDVICGYGEAMRFYEPRLGISRKADYFQNVLQLSPATAKRYRRLWYLDVLNMHPDVRERQARDASNVIEGLGFSLREPPIQFGGEEGTAFVFIFENKNFENRKTG